MARLEAGDQAPYFSLPDHDGETVTLDDYAGHRLVVYFYPAAFTPGCTTESCDFRDRHQDFHRAGYEIVGVSPDPVAKLADFRAEHDLPFPLLADEEHAIAEAYGAWGVKRNYGKEYTGIIRSTVVIDEEGTVTEAFYNVKATGHVERVAGSLAAT